MERNLTVSHLCKLRAEQLSLIQYLSASPVTLGGGAVQPLYCFISSLWLLSCSISILQWFEKII